MSERVLYKAWTDTMYGGSLIIGYYFDKTDAETALSNYLPQQTASDPMSGVDSITVKDTQIEALTRLMEEMKEALVNLQMETDIDLDMAFENNSIEQLFKYWIVPTNQALSSYQQYMETKPTDR